MELSRYITDEKQINDIKDKYLDSNLTMKDYLNGEYKNLPIEDKVNLVCWSCDNDEYEVLKNGTVVEKRLG